MDDSLTTLDYAHRWLRDGLQECGLAGGFLGIEADATMGAKILQRFKSQGVPVTWTHIFIRAAAMALARHPEVHLMVAGNSRLHPATVDICLSVAGDSNVTPVLIIEDAANKDLPAIAAEVIRRTPDAVAETQKMLALLRRFGWLAPFSGWRRAIMGFLLSRPWYRRKASGTFQVTCLPQVDLCAPLRFNTAGALGVGRVTDRVVAMDGKAVVRPMVTLYCSVDHAAWNGMECAKFLTALRNILESGQVVDDVAGDFRLPPGTAQEGLALAAR